MRCMPIGELSFRDRENEPRVAVLSCLRGATFLWSSPMRSFIALLAPAFIGLAFMSTDASARPFGGGARMGGFHGGFHGGFRGHGFRGFGPLVGVGVGLPLVSAKFCVVVPPEETFTLLAAALEYPAAVTFT